MEMVEQMAVGVNKELPLRIDVPFVEKVIQADLAQRRAAGAA